MNPILLETIIVCAGFVLLLAEALLPKIPKQVFGYLALAVVLAVFLLCFGADASKMNPDAPYAQYYIADTVALFFKKFLLLATACVLIFSLEFAPTLQRFLPSERPGGGIGEMYSLILFACAGMMWMVSANNFMMIFVSVELVTISFYIMVAYMRRSRASLEAGIKLLILGGISTGMNVFGIAWMLGALGTTNLSQIAALTPTLDPKLYPAILFSLCFILMAIGFKISAFPFQFWVPDVYQGAPTPITAFLAVASKASAFIVLMRILEPFLRSPALAERLIPAIAVIAALTLLMGNLAAIPQTNFKRLLAYSGISHAGYLLMGIASIASGNAGNAIAYYLVAYLIMTMLAFGVLVVVSNTVGSENLSDFNGLASRSPFLAAALTIGCLSLAGIPFTAGFIGKFFIFQSAVAAGQIPLVIVGVLAVACGYYYYLKVVRAMYWLPVPQTSEGAALPAISVSRPLAALLAVLVVMTLIFGVYPAPIFALLP